MDFSGYEHKEWNFRDIRLDCMLTDIDTTLAAHTQQHKQASKTAPEPIAFILSPFRTDNTHVDGDVWILPRLFVKNAWISQLIGLPN